METIWLGMQLAIGMGIGFALIPVLVIAVCAVVCGILERYK